MTRAIDWIRETSPTRQPRTEVTLYTVCKEREQTSDVVTNVGGYWSPQPMPDGPCHEYDDDYRRNTTYDAFIMSGSYEKIAYNNSHKSQYNYCDHEKRQFFSSGSSTVAWNLRQGDPSSWFSRPHQGKGYFGILPYLSTWYPDFYPFLGWREGTPPWQPRGHQFVWNFDLDSFLARAFEKMVPEIKSELSSLQTIAELRDVKSMFTGPLRFIRQLTKKQRSANRSFAELMKGIAGQHLNYSFGMKPFVKDIVGLYSTFISVERKLNQLVEGVGKTHTSHYSEKIDDQYWSSQFAHCQPTDTTWFVERDWTATGTYKVACTMKYKYTLVDAFGNPINLKDKNLLRMGAYLDSLGVRLDPSILWDLVPFSFVVDWFLSVGDWLESFSRNNLNSVIEILDCCYSVKETSVTRGTTIGRCARYQRYGLDGTVTDPIRGSAMFQVTDVRYTRDRFVPRSSWLHGEDLQPDTGSVSQWLLGASLLIVNGGRR